MKKKLKKKRKYHDRVIELTENDYDNIFGKTRGENIMEFIEKNDGATVAQITRGLKQSETNVRRSLQLFQDNGMIQKEKCKCGQGNIFTLSDYFKKK